MFKKIIIILVLLIWMFSIWNIANAGSCKFNWDIGTSIDNCFTLSDELFDADPDLQSDWLIEWSVKNQLLVWITIIAWTLWFFAVWSIVYWSFMLVISTWEEEKIKKAKDMIKWSILWFLGIILAASIITIIVEFMYSF